MGVSHEKKPRRLVVPAFEPGAIHSSASPHGCLIAVFMRGRNRLLEER